MGRKQVVSLFSLDLTLLINHSINHPRKLFQSLSHYPRSRTKTATATATSEKPIGLISNQGHTQRLFPAKYLFGEAKLA